MRTNTGLVLSLVAAVVGFSALTANSADIGVDGLRLIMKIDTINGKAKLLSLQRSAAITAGSGGNPAIVAGNLQVYYADDPGNSSSLDLPSPWLRNNGTVARFTNKLSPAGPTAVRAATIRSGAMVKVGARGLGGIDLSAPPGSGGVIVVYTHQNGNDSSVNRVCSRYSTADGSTVKHRVTARGYRLQLKRGVAVACPSCADGILNGDETDVDCGGSTCAACGDGSSCSAGSDCTSGVCSGGTCQAASCSDGVQNGSETDIDCGGGVCAPCGLGQNCSNGGDCATGTCSAGICVLPQCSNGIQDGDETDVDCGGASCPACDVGQGCLNDGDCVTAVCMANLCQAPSCSDGVQNGDETDTDCGGSCPGCGAGESCLVPADCSSGVCTGNVCQAPSCSDGLQNGDETDVDCGGSCPACSDGGSCSLASDCQSGVCTGNVCQAPSCSDGVKNGSETGTDCGGGCPGCPPGSACFVASDCDSGVCQSGLCQFPTCSDGVQNGDETGIDCGGTFCSACSCETRGECLMFVTSTNSGGNLGGLAGADATCNARAAAASLVGTYQAWLCDGVTAPADRSHKATVPYRRTDGALIANNWADLTDGSLSNPINRNEFGADVSASAPFLPWTYVTTAGTCDTDTYLSPGSGPCPAFSNCKRNCANDGANNGWTSSSGFVQGSKGDINATGGNWTDGASGLCSTPTERIYCIEQ